MDRTPVVTLSTNFVQIWLVWKIWSFTVATRWPRWLCYSRHKSNKIAINSWSLPFLSFHLTKNEFFKCTTLRPITVKIYIFTFIKPYRYDYNLNLMQVIRNDKISKKNWYCRSEKTDMPPPHSLGLMTWYPMQLFTSRHEHKIDWRKQILKLKKICPKTTNI